MELCYRVMFEEVIQVELSSQGFIYQESLGNYVLHVVDQQPSDLTGLLPVITEVVCERMTCNTHTHSHTHHALTQRSKCRSCTATHTKQNTNIQIFFQYFRLYSFKHRSRRQPLYLHCIKLAFLLLTVSQLAIELCL